MPVLPSSDVDPATVPEWAHRYRASDHPAFGYTADVLAFSINAASASLDGLFVRRGRPPFAGCDAFPGGFVDWMSDRTAELAGARELREETGQATLEFLETLDTYDENGRDPRQFAGHPGKDGTWVATGVRVVSKAFIAAVRPDESPPVAASPDEDAADAFWRDVYHYLPWEDLRAPRGRRAAREVRQRLGDEWVRAAGDRGLSAHRAATVARLFGRAGLRGWNEERAPERFDLLMDVGMLEEAGRDQWGNARSRASAGTGTALAFDHRRMLADALGRLRGKIKYAPAVLAALLGPRITAVTLHRGCEAIAGRPIHHANLRRAFVTAGLLTEEGFLSASAGPGRPARQYGWAPGIMDVRLDQALKIPWSQLPAR